MGEIKVANQDTLLNVQATSNAINTNLGKSTDAASISGTTIWSRIKAFLDMWTQTKANNIDTTISSRAATADVTAVKNLIGDANPTTADTAKVMNYLKKLEDKIGSGGNLQQHFSVNVGDFQDSISIGQTYFYNTGGTNATASTGVNTYEVYTLSENIYYVFSAVAYGHFKIDLSNNTITPIAYQGIQQPKGGFIHNGEIYFVNATYFYIYNFATNTWRNSGSGKAIADSYVISADGIKFYSVPVTGVAGKVWNSSDGTSVAIAACPITLTANAYTVWYRNNCLYWINHTSTASLMNYKFDPATNVWTNLGTTAPSTGHDGTALSIQTGNVPILHSNKLYYINKGTGFMIYDFVSNSYSFLSGLEDYNTSIVNNYSSLYFINGGKHIVVYSCNSTQIKSNFVIYDIEKQMTIPFGFQWMTNWNGDLPYTRCVANDLIVTPYTNGASTKLYGYSVRKSDFMGMSTCWNFPVIDVLKGETFFSTGYFVDSNYNLYYPNRNYIIQKNTTMFYLVPTGSDSTRTATGWVKHLS